MLEIVFVGTGAAIPTMKRSLASVWMKYSSEQSEALLFDCGEGAQLRLMNARLGFMKIDHIFISHWHADHWSGLLGLLQTMNLEGRRKPLHVYGPEADRFVDAILELGYWAPRYQVIAHEVPFEGDEMTTVYQSKDFAILSTPARHSVPAVVYCFKENDKVNVDLEKAKRFGLGQGRLVGQLKAKGSVVVKGKRVKLDQVASIKPGLKVVYTGDTKSCATLDAIAKDADLLIHDSTFEDEKATAMHAGAVQAAETAKKAGVQQLILTHFSRRYPDISELEKKARAVFPNTRAAKDLMKIRMKRGVYKVDA